MKNGIGLHPVAGTENPDRELDVLFIHGLGGDAFTTWQYENKAEYFWPKAMAKEFPDKIGVWTVAYGATPSKWVEDVMPMEDRAQNLLSHFSANGVGKRPFTLVAHSMGGLIAKYMLTDARFSSNPEYREIVNNCKGVVFLAVPHLGSGWSNLLDFARVFVRGNKIVRQLEKDSSSLRRLDGQFGELSEERGFVSHAFIETKEVRTTKKVLGFIPIPKGIKIVSESSAGAIKVLGRPVPMDDDHLSICKLKSPRDLLYLKMKGIIKEYLQLAAIEPASEKKKTDEVVKNSEKVEVRKGELRGYKHWLYHTIAHDYFKKHSVLECFESKNYFVGFLIGDSNDEPLSFAVDYYTRLKKIGLEDDAWENRVLHLDLDGSSTKGFQYGLRAQFVPDPFGVRNDREIDAVIKSRLIAEKIFVFSVQIHIKEEADVVIHGAIEYLKTLDIQDAYVAVIFNCTEPIRDSFFKRLLSKLLGKKLPEDCVDMDSLRRLAPADYKHWLDTIKKRELRTERLEEELLPLKGKLLSTYTETLEILEKLPPKEVFKGKYK